METNTKPRNGIDPQKLKTWTEQGEKKEVRILGNSGNISSGEIYLKSWSKGERIKRSSLWGGIFFFIAAFCVLIPILHFVLVPVFLILTPVVAFKTYQQKSVILGGFGTCPRCKEPLPIEKAKESWPLSDLCTHCHNSVKIEAIDA